MGMAIYKHAIIFIGKRMEEICFISSAPLPTVLLRSTHFHPIPVMMVIEPEQGIHRRDHVQLNAELSPLLWLNRIWCYVLCCTIHLCSAEFQQVRVYSNNAPQTGVPLKMWERRNTEIFWQRYRLFICALFAIFMIPKQHNMLGVLVVGPSMLSHGHIGPKKMVKNYHHCEIIV